MSWPVKKLLDFDLVRSFCINILFWLDLCFTHSYINTVFAVFSRKYLFILHDALCYMRTQFLHSAAAILKGSPSAEPSLCFLKDIITKFCFINSILTTDISIESSFKVSIVFTAAINSKRVLNFPWLGNSLIFKNAISDVTSKYDYLNISSFPVESSNMKRRKAFHSFHFFIIFFCYGSHEFTFTRIN